MVRARSVWGRVVAVSAMGWIGMVVSGSPVAAQTYPGQTLPYEQSAAPSYFRLPSVQPAAHTSIAGEDPAAPAVVEGGDIGCNGAASDCGCDSGCDYGCAGPRGCDRWYVAIMGGYQDREMVHETGDPSTFIGFEGGFSMNAALGYRFDAFRIEAEYSFMNNECSTAGSGGLSSDTVGNINLRALMFNIYHDFDIPGCCWKPYLGAGIGIYQSEINGLFPEFFQTVGGAFATTPLNCTSNMPLAYQFRAGASRPIGERTELFAGYRYFHGEQMEFSSAPFASGGAPTFNPDGAWTHGVEFGLRIKF
jgi:opacity protein-like surface antigen